MPTTLITGANRGIGLQLATLLTARGHTVIAAVRQSSPELDALGATVESLDVADDASVAALGQRLEGTPIDLLIHNAGVLIGDALHAIDLDAIRTQFEVNSLGPLKLTAALRGCLSKGSTVAILTSRMGSIADNTSGGAYGYRMSKAAVNAMGKSLANDLKDDGIAVVLLHPGWVRTEMTSHNGLVDPDESAEGLLARIDETTMGNTGRFVHMNGDPLPW